MRHPLQGVLLAALIATFGASRAAAERDEDTQGTSIKFYIIRMKEIYRIPTNELKSPDGTVAVRLVLAAARGLQAKVRLFSAGTWLPLGPEIVTNEPVAFAIAPDNKTIAIGTTSSEVNVYDGLTGKKIDTWKWARINSLKFTDDSKTLKVYCHEEERSK